MASQVGLLRPPPVRRMVGEGGDPVNQTPGSSPIRVQGGVVHYGSPVVGAPSSLRQRGGWGGE